MEEMRAEVEYVRAALASGETAQYSHSHSHSHSHSGAAIRAVTGRRPGLRLYLEKKMTPRDFAMHVANLDMSLRNACSETRERRARSGPLWLTDTYSPRRRAVLYVG